MKKKKVDSTMLWVHVCIAMLLIVLMGLVVFFGKKIYQQQQIIRQSMLTNVNSANFTCDQEKKIMANFFDNKVELALPDGRNLLLMAGLSGSGVRYTNWDESVTFWNKGETGFLEEGSANEVTYANCVETPEK